MAWWKMEKTLVQQKWKQRYNLNYRNTNKYRAASNNMEKCHFSDKNSWVIMGTVVLINNVNNIHMKTSSGCNYWSVKDGLQICRLEYVH